MFVLRGEAFRGLHHGVEVFSRREGAEDWALLPYSGAKAEASGGRTAAGGGWEEERS